MVNLYRIFFLGTKKTTQLINVIKHCGIITLIYKSLKKSLIKIYFMLSLFDHITTKKPQFDAYPFSNQSVIQRWKGTRWKIKNLICSDEIGVVRMNSEGLLRRKSFLFGWIRTCFDGYGFVWTNILFLWQIIFLFGRIRYLLWRIG